MIHRSRTRKLVVESLENRTLLAGNVTASLSGGSLYVTGDDQSNTISVESIGAGNVQVRGFGTSVNGSPDAIKTFSVPGSIVIRMNDGDDLVRVTNLVIHVNLWVDLGPGTNEILTGQTAAGDNLRFAGTPSGPLFVSANLGITGGVGNDRIFQSNVHVQGGGNLSAGDGDDNLQLDRPTGSVANVEYSGLFQVYPGRGTDNLSINGLLVDDNMVVNDANGAAAISMNNMDVHGDLTMTTANIGDSINIQNANIDNVLTISSQGGYDNLTISVIADRLVIDAGGGNDQVHVSSSRINVMIPVLGAGADQLDLLSDTAGKIYAYGSDGNDLFLVRNTSAVDAFFNGDAGDDTYEDSAALRNHIGHLHLNSIEHTQRV